MQIDAWICFLLLNYWWCLRYYLNIFKYIQYNIEEQLFNVLYICGEISRVCFAYQCMHIIRRGIQAVESRGRMLHPYHIIADFRMNANSHVRSSCDISRTSEFTPCSSIQTFIASFWASEHMRLGYDYEMLKDKYLFCVMFEECRNELSKMLSYHPHRKVWIKLL